MAQQIDKLTLQKQRRELLTNQELNSLVEKTNDIIDAVEDIDTTVSRFPKLATVATSGSYTDLSDKPTIPNVSEKADRSELSAVAFSGSYNDLTNKPEITLSGQSVQQVQADWNQSNDLAVDYIKNKPSIPTVPTNISSFTNDAGYLTSHQDISGKTDSSDLAAVAFSGSYDDLTDKPADMIQVQSDWDQSDNSAVDYIKNKPTIPTVPTNVSSFINDVGYLTQHQDVSNKANTSDLATVAISGSYKDLKNIPQNLIISKGDDSFWRLLINFNGHQYVDLGLPSGTLWSTTIISNNYYNSDTGEICIAGNTPEQLPKLDDIVNAVYGGDWTTPTILQFCELVQFCDVYCQYYDNTADNIREFVLVTFTSKINGNCITIGLPAGYIYDVIDSLYVRHNYYIGALAMCLLCYIGLKNYKYAIGYGSDIMYENNGEVFGCAYLGVINRPSTIKLLSKSAQNNSYYQLDNRPENFLQVSLPIQTVFGCYEVNLIIWNGPILWSSNSSYILDDHSRTSNEIETKLKAEIGNDWMLPSILLFLSLLEDKDTIITYIPLNQEHVGGFFVENKGRRIFLILNTNYGIHNKDSIYWVNIPVKSNSFLVFTLEYDGEKVQYYFWLPSSYVSGGCTVIPVKYAYLAATVASTGSYNDLTDKPIIPTVPANETASSGGSTLSVVTTGEKYTWNNKANIWTGTQTLYDALSPNYDTNTIYIIS